MRYTHLALVVAAAIAAGQAQAEVSLNGFASVKAGTTFGSDDTLYGYTSDVDFKPESLFAIQAQSDLGEKFSVTAQLMAKGNDDFNSKFAWAFLSYQASEHVRINAGRIRVPFYKYSDYLDVGYAYDWARTPRSVYDVPFDTMDGASAIISNSFGDWQSAVQLNFGAFNGSVNVEGVKSPSKMQNIMGGSWELSNDWFSTRAAYFKADVSIQSDALDPLLAALNQYGFAGVAKEIDFDEDAGSFVGVGFGIDKNDWLVNSEWTRVEIDHSFMAQRDSWFFSVGHRFGSWTPYVSHEVNRDKADPAIYASIPGVHPLRPLVAGLVDGQEDNTKVYNVGFRYDFHPSAAFKAELTSADNTIADQKTTLLTLGVDLVF